MLWKDYFGGQTWQEFVATPYRVIGRLLEFQKAKNEGEVRKRNMEESKTKIK